MEKRFSEMTEFEIKQEIAGLHEKANKAQQLGIINEYDVYKRKIVLAEAYLLDPNDFHPGEKYYIKDFGEEIFTISYMNGVFAWGNREGNPEEEAFPISLLQKC